MGSKHFHSGLYIKSRILIVRYTYSSNSTVKGQERQLIKHKKPGSYVTDLGAPSPFGLPVYPTRLTYSLVDLPGGKQRTFHAVQHPLVDS